MHVRLLTWRNAKNIDDEVTYLREKVMPTIAGLNGFRGVTAAAYRADEILSVLSLWETESDREASLGALSQARREATDIAGGELTLESFEQMVAAAGPTPPGVGSWLQVRSLSMDPAKIDENVAHFEANVMPHFTTNPGFQGLSPHRSDDRDGIRGKRLVRRGFDDERRRRRRESPPAGVGPGRDAQRAQLSQNCVWRPSLSTEVTLTETAAHSWSQPSAGQGERCAPLSLTVFPI